ncbi:DUF4158 domain-containing protein [Streptomyces sp. NPDC048424]|uniref:DUF4158 domain-containing protein n=1 Tax=Streptomyces sp. NPDC048424 TaxID=3155265 RepID=UPI00342D2E5E
MATRGAGDEAPEALRSFPTIVKDELIRCFTLTPADRASLQEFRRAQKVLGAAVQLLALPRPGGVPDDEPAAPAAAVGRMARRDGATR